MGVPYDAPAGQNVSKTGNFCSRRARGPSPGSVRFRSDGLIAYGHGLESLELGLNPGPLLRIPPGVNGCGRVGVKVLDIRLEAGRH